MPCVYGQEFCEARAMDHVLIGSIMGLPGLVCRLVVFVVTDTVAIFVPLGWHSILRSSSDALVTHSSQIRFDVHPDSRNQPVDGHGSSADRRPKQPREASFDSPNEAAVDC